MHSEFQNVIQMIYFITCIGKYLCNSAVYTNSLHFTCYYLVSFRL